MDGARSILLSEVTKINQEQINKPNTHITNKEIETVINCVPTKKCSGPDTLSAEFYQICKEHLIPIILNYST